MTNEVAEIGFSFPTGPLERGARKLEDLEPAAVKADRGLDRLERQTKKTNSTFGDLARGGGTSILRSLRGLATGAAVAVTAMLSFGAVVGTISTFETSISRLGAVSGATTTQLGEMRNVARDLGATTEFTASQAADGLNFLAMAGFTAQESVAAIPAVLDLATASGLGLAQAADTTSNIMSGFAIAAENAADVADVLAAASSRANTDVAQLGDAMSTVAPIAAALDISLADTAASIGILSDAGIQGARAGTALRGVLASLAGPTDQAVSVLQKLGLTIQDIDPATNELSVVMQRLGAAGLSTADAMTIFGREAASGALVLVDGATRLGVFGDELERVNGAAGDMADTMRDNLGGDIKTLQSAVSGLILELGDAGLTAVLRSVVQGITAVTRAISFVVSAFGAAGDAFASLVGGASAAQIATDNLTLAMGDEIDQANKLLLAIEPNRVMSVDVAGAKLAQAQAHLAAADAQRQEAVQLTKMSDEYQRQQELIDNNRRILQQYRDLEAQGERAGEFEANQIAELNRQLREAVELQQQMVDEAGQTSAEYNAVQAEINRLQVAIDNSVDGVVNLNGQVVTSNELSARLSNVVNSITFGNAIGGAEALAQRLGVSLSIAQQIAASAGTSNVGDEVFDPRSPRFNPSAQAAVNRQNTLDEIRKSFEDVEVAAVGASRGTSSVGRAARETKDDLNEVEKSARTFAEELDGPVTSAIGRASDEFGDFAARGFRDFESMKDGILGSFQDMISQMIALAARNTIMLSLGLGGGAGAGTGGLLSGLLGGGQGGGLLGGVGGLAGLGSAFSGGLSFFTSGVSSGFAAGGLGGALSGGASALGTAFAGASGGLGGLAAAAGAVALPALAVAGLVSFLSTKKKTIDSGISAIVTVEDAVFSTYEEIEKSRFWGLSKKRSTELTALTGSTDDIFQQTTRSIQDSVISSAQSLGVSTSVFDNFSFEFKASLDGLTEAAQQQKIQEEFERMGNAMASQINGLDQFAQAGESSNETLTRLSTSLVTVNDVFRDLGFNAMNISLAGADAASSFVDLFGSLEQFQNATSIYYDRFFSDQEKQANLSARIEENLRDLGINFVPKTNAAFRDLVETAMSAGDTEMAAALIQLAPSFDALTQATKDLTAAFNADAFASGIDFRRGQALTANGLSYSAEQSQAQMLAEIRALRAQQTMAQSTMEITAANTGKAADAANDSLALQVTGGI